MKIQLIRELEGLENFWPIALFNRAYSQNNSLRQIVLATLSSQLGNPDKTSLLIFRSFIKKGEKAKEDQKYILALRFYNFGDMATLDLISLNLGFHRQIACEHIEKMNWSFVDQQADEFDKTIQTPFLLVGGHLRLVDEKIIFSKTSQDYGNSLFLSDSNAVAEYFLGHDQSGQGENFVQQLSEFMLANKQRPDFYEQFFSKMLINFSNQGHFNSQQINSLLTMKVLDRIINEKKEPLGLLTEETTRGFGRYVMLASVADKLKRSKK